MMKIKNKRRARRGGGGGGWEGPSDRFDPGGKEQPISVENVRVRTCLLGSSTFLFLSLSFSLPPLYLYLDKSTTPSN